MINSIPTGIIAIVLFIVGIIIGSSLFYMSKKKDLSELPKLKIELEKIRNELENSRQKNVELSNKNSDLIKENDELKNKLKSSGLKDDLKNDTSNKQNKQSNESQEPDRQSKAEKVLGVVKFGKEVLKIVVDIIKIFKKKK